MILVSQLVFRFIIASYNVDLRQIIYSSWGEGRGGQTHVDSLSFEMEKQLIYLH